MHSPKKRISYARGALTLVVALTAFGGCYNTGNGSDPIDNQLYFPVAATVSESGLTLFVVNSDFDLAYNAGTLEALDARMILADALACGKLDNRPAGTPPSATNTPPRYFQDCAEVGVDERTVEQLWGGEHKQYFLGSVRIGAFGADVKSVPLYSSKSPQTSSDLDPVTNLPIPADNCKGRLLIPDRGDAALLFVDYSETGDGCGRGGTPTKLTSLTLMCNGGQTATPTGASCGDDHKVGNDAGRFNLRGITIPGEPFAVAVTSWQPVPPDPKNPTGPTNLRPLPQPNAVGGVAAVIHQSTGSVSAFVGVNLTNDGSAGNLPSEPPGGAPTGVVNLAFTLTGMPTNGTNIVALDEPSVTVSGFVPRFMSTATSVASIYTTSFTGDPGTPERSFLGVSDISPIPPNAPGNDSRSIVVDPPNSKESPRNTRVFISSRSPASVVFGEIDPVLNHTHFYDHLALPVGPSRMTRDSIDDKKTRLYATSFDARTLISIDPDAQRIGNVMFTGRGPFSFTISDKIRDANGDPHKVGFLVTFTDSTLQVVDLEPMMKDGTANPRYEHIIYTVGVIQGPRT